MQLSPYKAQFGEGNFFEYSLNCQQAKSIG